MVRLVWQVLLPFGPSLPPLPKIILAMFVRVFLSDFLFPLKDRGPKRAPPCLPFPKACALAKLKQELFCLFICLSFEMVSYCVAQASREPR